MKRRKLLKHLKTHGCVLLKEGGNHSKLRNPRNGRSSILGRHTEIRSSIVKAICEQLAIPAPEGER